MSTASFNFTRFDKLGGVIYIVVSGQEYQIQQFLFLYELNYTMG